MPRRAGEILSLDEGYAFIARHVVFYLPCRRVRFVKSLVVIDEPTCTHQDFVFGLPCPRSFEKNNSILVTFGVERELTVAIVGIGLSQLVCAHTIFDLKTNF